MEYYSLDFLLNKPPASNHKTPEKKPETLERLLEEKENNHTFAPLFQEAVEI